MCACPRVLCRAWKQMAVMVLAGLLHACDPELAGTVAGGLTQAPMSDTVAGQYAQPSGAPRSVVAPVLGPPRDSAGAVAIARRVLQDGVERNAFTIAHFLEIDDGFLVKVLPHPATPGGGGLLWIDVDGSAWILRRYR